MGRDSITSFNERGCDEIMCQFMKDLELSYEIEIEKEVD